MKITIKVETHKGNIYVSYILKKSRWKKETVYLICFREEGKAHYTTSSKKYPLYSGTRKSLMSREPLTVINQIASREFSKLDPFNLREEVYKYKGVE